MYTKQHRPTLRTKLILSAYIIIAIICFLLLGHFSTNIAQTDSQSQNHLTQPTITRHIESHWNRSLTTTNHMWVVIHTSKFTPSKQEKADSMMNYLEEYHKRFGIKHVIAPIDNKNDEHNLESHHTQLVQLSISKHKSLPVLTHQLQQHLHAHGLHVYFTSHDSIQSILANQDLNLQSGITITFAILSFILFWYAFSSAITALFSTLCSIICVEIAKCISLLPSLIPQLHLLKSNMFSLNIFLIILLSLSTIYNFIFNSQMQNEIRYQSNDLNNIQLARRNTNMYTLPYFSALALGSLILPNGLSLTCDIITIYLLQPWLQTIITRYYPQFILPIKNHHEYMPKRITACLLLLLLFGIVGISSIESFHTHSRFQPLQNLRYANQLEQGQSILHNDFPTNVTQPTYIYLSSHHSLASNKNLNDLDKLTIHLDHNKNIHSVHSFTQPTGSPLSSLYLSNQLRLLSTQSLSSNKLINIQDKTKLKHQLSLMDKNYEQFGRIRLQSLHTTSSKHALKLIKKQHRLITNINNSNSLNTNDLVKLNQNTNKLNHIIKHISRKSITHQLYMPASILNSSLFTKTKSEYYSHNYHSTVLRVGTKRNLSHHQLNSIITSIHCYNHGTSLSNTKVGMDSIHYQNLYSKSHIFNKLWLPVIFCGLITCLVLIFLKHRLNLIMDLILALICSTSSIGLLNLVWHTLIISSSASILLLTIIFSYLTSAIHLYNKVKHPVLWIVACGSISLMCTNQLGLLQIGVGTLISYLLMLLIKSNCHALLPNK